MSALNQCMHLTAFARRVTQHTFLALAALVVASLVEVPAALVVAALGETPVVLARVCLCVDD